MIASAWAMIVASWLPLAIAAHGSAGLPVDERDPPLVDGPGLRGVRERAGPLVVVVVDRELPSDLGLDAQDRVVLGLVPRGSIREPKYAVAGMRTAGGAFVAADASPRGSNVETSVRMAANARNEAVNLCWRTEYTHPPLPSWNTAGCSLRSATVPPIRHPRNGGRDADRVLCSVAQPPDLGLKVCVPAFRRVCPFADCLSVDACPYAIGPGVSALERVFATPE